MTNYSRPLGVSVVGLLFLSSIASLGRADGQDPEDDKAIRAAVIGYLQAKNGQERLAFIHEAAKFEKLFQEKYQGKPFPLANQKVQKVEKLASADAYLVKATWTEKPANKSFAGYYVVRKTKAGFKVDWPASIGYNATSLKSLVASKPKEGATLRLIAKIDTKYTGDYVGARDSHYCFLLKEDFPLQTVLAYVPKTDPGGKRLYDQLKKGGEARDRVILEIRFVGPTGKELQKSPPTASITKVVSETWVEK